MPRLPINYSKAIIYKLCCKNPEITDIYVGSTTHFRKRKNDHKKTCNNQKNKRHHLKVYQFIRDNGGWNNWEMIEIEKYEAVDKLDLHKRERYWLEELQASLNGHIPSRTRKEYREENKEKIAQLKKEHYENNKEKIAQLHKEYYEENKEKIIQKNKEYNKENKEKIMQYMKEYNKKNKEKLLKQMKEYRQNNKEKMKVKITCECGAVVRRYGITRHRKTKKHQEYVNSI